MDQNKELPQGLGMALSQDISALERFTSLPSGEKQKAVDYIRASTTGNEAKKRIHEVIEQVSGPNGSQT